MSLVRYFLSLGTTGFGGPVALVGKMRSDLVEKRGWISEAEFKEGLALAQLAPGPLAAQLAIYIGWLRHRTIGATVVGIAFVLPSLLIVLALAEWYRRAGTTPVIANIFYGVGAAVIAVIARSAIKLAKSTITDIPLWCVAGINAIATIYLQRESILLVALSGLAMFPARRATTASLLPIFTFFAISGLVVFGSGLAIIPFLHGGLVTERHWITERQFLDAVAVSLITPGPVVITVAFIGSLIAGLKGGLAAALGVFLPSYVVVLLIAPHFKSIKPFIRGVTAAAIGALAGAVVVMAFRTLTDPLAIGIAIVAMLLLLRRVPDPVVLLAAAPIGFLR